MGGMGSADMHGIPCAGVEITLQAIVVTVVVGVVVVVVVGSIGRLKNEKFLFSLLALFKVNYFPSENDVVKLQFWSTKRILLSKVTRFE